MAFILNNIFLNKCQNDGQGKINEEKDSRNIPIIHYSVHDFPARQIGIWNALIE